MKTFYRLLSLFLASTLLAALARAGFDYDTASRVIGNSSSSDDEL